MVEEKEFNTESIYHFYKDQLLPSVMASLPFLLLRILQDLQLFLSSAFHRLLQISLLASLSEKDLLSLPQLWWQERKRFTVPEEERFPDLLFRYCDADGDGRISRAESLCMSENTMAHFSASHRPSRWVWLSREWFSTDWKVEVLVVWILLLLSVLSVIPGRCHGLAAQLLRWPVWLVTNSLIIVELWVYVVIRLIIRTTEYLIARPKHRRLRQQLAQARSYAEWYALASELDQSQKRDNWLRELDDPIGSRYNWGFVLELLKDLRAARDKKDSILALAVLQQCFRKNVGGVMSEDIFSYSNTGEPKYVVTEFVKEVTATIRWVTEDAMKAEPANQLPTYAEKVLDTRLQNELRNEKDMLRKSLFCATLQFATGQAQAELSGCDSSSDDDDDADLGNHQKLDSKDKKFHSGSKQETTLTTNDTSFSLSGGGGQKSSSTQKSISDPPIPTTQLHRAEVLAFLKRARAVYGRTALCLSGGAMMGLYHFGHLIGLLETGTLPHIVSGASAGSIVAALLCTRTDEELRRDMKPEVLQGKLVGFRSTWSQRLDCLWRTGALFSADEWLSLFRWFTCGDMTFEEAYNKTGRIFCVTLSSTTKKASPIMLNYLTAPDVVISSACLASAALPGLIPPVRLQYKDPDGTIRGPAREKDETYFDGSIRQDIPVNGLAEILNCQFFVVCQANPYVVPFLFGSKGKVGRPSRWSSGTQESSWRGGFLLAALEMYLRLDMKNKHSFLNEMEAAVGYTSTLIAQQFKGSTTIAPQVSFWDYFRVMRDPKLNELYNYFQAGAVAAYEHVAMIKLHFVVADGLEECIGTLEGKGAKSRRRSVVKIPLGPTKPKVFVENSPKREVGLDDSRPRMLSFILGPDKSGEWPLTRSNVGQSVRDWLHPDE